MPVDLDTLEALGNAATPGEWAREDTTFLDGVYGLTVPGSGKFAQAYKPSDADYIVAAQPTNILPLLQEIRELRAANEWISVEEKLPEDSEYDDGEDYTIVAAGRVFNASWKDREFWGHDSDNGFYEFRNVTHYRELPKGPTK